MAVGKRYSEGMPDYIGMARGAGQEGLETAKGLGDLLSQGFNLGSKMGDRARMQQARTVFGDAWASGDPEAIMQAMQLFPEYAKEAQDFIGIRDEQHRKDVGSLMMKLNGLAGVGDAEGIAALVDQSGSLLDKQTGQRLKQVAALLNDPQKAAAAKGFLDRYTNAMAVSTVSPLEAIKHATESQRLAQQYQLGTMRIDLQRELGADRNQLGWANYGLRKDWQSMTPQQRNFEFATSLPEDQRAQFLASLPGAGLGARMNMQEKRLFQSQIKDTIKGPQQKQYYMQMAEKAMTQLQEYKKGGNKAGAAEAYHNVRNALARAAMGGNATLNESQIEQATGLPAFMDEKANTLGLKVNGMPSDMFMDSTHQQIKDDLQNERETIANQGNQFYSSLIAQGHTPEDANDMINGALAGTGIGGQDWANPQVGKKSSDGEGKTVDFKDLRK